MCGRERSVLRSQEYRAKPVQMRVRAFFVLFEMRSRVKTHQLVRSAIRPDPERDILSHDAAWEENRGFLSEELRELALEAVQKFAHAVDIGANSMLLGVACELSELLVRRPIKIAAEKTRASGAKGLP